MDAHETSPPAGEREREHLKRAHHEICTALTVFRSNVELVRLDLRGASLPGNGARIRAHLDELENAVERLRAIANEMKRWHDGVPLTRGERASDPRGHEPQQQPLLRSPP